MAIVETAFNQTVAPAYLTVDDQAIYEVAPNSVLNIGRLDTNDIVLDDYKVSREHAVLKFSRSQMMLIDLASTHGSFVNGDRVERCVLNFGDTIQIVSHELTLSRELPLNILSESGRIEMPRMARSLDRQLKFFGGLNDFSLLTLVQFLYQEKQSGLLLLEVGQMAGPRIYIQHGDIIHVSQGENLAELLVCRNHEPSLFFYFHHETKFPKRTIVEPTMTYLMNLCSTHDEHQLQPTTLWAKPKGDTGGVPIPTATHLVDIF